MMQNQVQAIKMIAIYTYIPLILNCNMSAFSGRGYQAGRYGGINPMCDAYVTQQATREHRPKDGWVSCGVVLATKEDEGSDWWKICSCLSLSTISLFFTVTSLVNTISTTKQVGCGMVKIMTWHIFTPFSCVMTHLSLIVYRYIEMVYG